MTIIGSAEVALNPDVTGFGLGLEQKLKGIVGAMSSPLGLVTLGAVAAGTALFSIGESFEAAYKKIRSGTGATEEQMGKLETSFKNVLKSGPASMTQVADALSLVSVRTKLTGADLEDLTKTELKLARITGGEVKNLVDVSTQAFANFGIEGVGPSKLALNELLQISQTTGVGVEQLATSVVGKAGATFRAMGLDIGSAASILGTLEAQGVSTGPVIMGLSKAVTAAQKEGKDAKTAMTELFDTLKNGVQGTPAYADAIKTLGSRGFLTLADAVKTGKISIDEFNGAFQADPGRIDRIAKENQTLGGLFKTLKNEVLVALEPVAMRFLELANVVIRGAVEQIRVLFGQAQMAVEAFAGAFSNGDITSDGWIGVVEHAGVVARQVFDGVRESWDALMGGFDNPDARNNVEGFTGALITFGQIVSRVSDFMGDHWRPILIGVGLALSGGLAPTLAIVAGFVLLYQRSQLVRDALAALGAAAADFARFFIDRWEKIHGSLQTIFAGLRLLFIAFVAVTLGPALLAWRYFGDQILAVVKLAFDAVGTVLSTAVRIIGDVFDFVTSILTGKWGDAWNALADIPRAVIDGWMGMLSNLGGFLVDFFASLPGNIISAAGDLGGLLLPVGQSIVGGIVDGITGAASAVFVAASGLATPVIEGVVALPGQIIGALAALPGMLADFLPAAWHAAIEGVTTAIAAGIVAWLALLVGVPFLVFTGLRELGPKLLDAFKNGFVTVVTAIPGLITTIVNAFTSLPGLLLDAGRSALTALWDGIKEVWAREVHFWSELPGKILAALGNVGSWLLDAGTKVLHGLWDGIASMKGWLVSMVLGIPGWILGALSGFGNLLWDVAVNIVVGFWHGLESMGPWLLGKIGDFFGAVVHKVTDFLSILSPSRVFVEIGQQVGAGFALGMTSTADAVAAAAQSMAAASIGPAQDAAAQAAAALAAGMAKAVDIMHNVGALDDADYLQVLKDRIAGTVEFSTEWETLWNQIIAVNDRVAQEHMRLHDVMYKVGEISTVDYLAMLNRRLDATVKYSQEWEALWGQIRQINDQVALDHQHIHDVMFQVGDLSTNAYLGMLQKRLDATEKYSSDWYAIWQQIKQINDSVAADAKKLADDLAKTAAATAANVERQWAATYAAQDAAASLHLEQLRNEVKLGMTGAADELKHLLSDQLLNLPQFSNAWMTIRNELMALNNPTGPSPSSVPSAATAAAAAAAQSSSSSTVNPPIVVQVQVDGAGVVSLEHADLIGQRAGAATRRELVSVIHGA